MWNLPAPPGFQGLREDKPLRVYHRHLPHWRQEGATYFATFRLADSLPQNKLHELDGLREEWERRHPAPRSSSVLDELAQEMATQVEKWLDLGMGSCHLRDPRIAKFVVDSMQHFDGQRYELGAFVVMPNHAHVIVRPLCPGEHDLEQILGGWKQFCSNRINGLLGTEGGKWQDESFDRIIRDEEHLYRVIQYIGRNPERANLSLDACPRWIRPQWRKLGWDFEPLKDGRS